MNLKATVLMSAIALICLFSCSEIETNKPNAIRAVKIKVSNRTETRVTGPHVSNQAVVFSSGYLFFTNMGGTITKMIAIDNSNNPESGGTVGIEALKNGTLIQNVPGNSEKVYILGNLSPALPSIIVGSTNISVINEFAIDLEGLYDRTNKGVDKVPVFGAPGAITPDGNDYKASLTIAPIGARMEVGKITGAGHITSFKVEGIFINYYYNRMKLNAGIVLPTDLQINGNNPNLYVPDATGSSYTIHLDGMIYDYAANGIGHFTSLALTPDITASPDLVWGYNLLAPTNCEMPHIVIRLSDVTTTLPDDPYANRTWFLTIKNFYEDSGTNNLPINILKARNVYRITNIIFTENDLATNPEESFKTVTVDVEVMPWISNDIGYDYQ